MTAREVAETHGSVAWIDRLLRRRPVILETIRPLEVPVITEAKRRDGLGDRAGAIRYAYAAVLGDLERAFGLRFPPHWTHEEIVEKGMRPEMAPIPDFLRRLLALYEPVRYGDSPRDLGDPVELLVSIYSHRAMWGLYADRRRAPPPPDPPPPAGRAS